MKMSGLNAKNAPARKDRQRLPHFSPNVERVRQPFRIRASDGRGVEPLNRRRNR